MTRAWPKWGLILRGNHESMAGMYWGSKNVRWIPEKGVTGVVTRALDERHARSQALFLSRAEGILGVERIR